MSKRLSILSAVLVLAIGGFVLYGLSLIANTSDGYLVFHTLVEMFGIIIAGAVFVVAWNSRHYMQNNYLLLVGVSMLFVALIHLLHTLAYKGMPIFPGYDSDLPTQLWIAARYLTAASFVIAPLLLNRKVRPHFILLVYALVSAALISSIFLRRFPACFVQNHGLTTFKVVSELSAAGACLIGIGLLIWKRRHFNSQVLFLIVAAIAVQIVAAIAFTLYTHPYGAANKFGHLLWITASYLLYKAIIETGLRRPYDLLFRNLKQSEQALRESQAIFQSFMDHLPACAYIKDAAGRFIYLNNYTADAFDARPADWLGKTVSDLFSPPVADQLEQADRQVLNLNRTIESIDTAPQADGTHSYLTYKFPILQQGRQAVAGISIDITERQKAELQREEHLQRLNQLIAVSQQVLAETDINGLLQKMADGARRLTNARLAVAGHGFTDGNFRIGAASREKDLPPCPPEKAFRMERGGVYLDLIQHGKRTIRLTDEELRNHPLYKGLPENHAPLHGLLGASLVGLNNQTSGMLMVSDRTDGEFSVEDEMLLAQLAALGSLALQHIEAHNEAERRAAEAEEGRQTLHSLMDNVPAGIAIADTIDGPVRMVSKYGRELTGADSQDSSENPKAWNLFHLDGITPASSDELPLTRSVATGEVVFDEEWLLRLNDGRQIPLLCNAGPIRDRNGNITGGVIIYRDITVLIAAQRAAEHQASELAAVFNAMVNSVIVYDVNGNIVRCNPAAAAHGFDPALHESEYSRNDVLDRLAIRFPDGRPIKPQDLPSYRAAHGQIIRDEKYIFRDSFGRDIAARFSAAPFYADGRLAGVVAVWHDVSEQERLISELASARRELEQRVYQRTADLQRAVDALQAEVYARTEAESALHAINDLLEQMFASIHVHVAYMDRDFNFIRVNLAYAAADGKNPQWFIGRNHFDLYPNPENEAIFREVVRMGESCFFYERPFEYTSNPERGTTFWDWSLQPVKDSQGRVTGIILSLLDATERVRGRQQIELERQRLFSVLHMLPGYVSLHAPDHSVRFANHRFQELFGYPDGRACHQILHGSPTPCLKCRVKSILDNNEPQEWEWTSPAGRSYHVWGYPFYDIDGSELVMELGVDVTDRKHLEKQIFDIGEQERRRIGQDLHDVLGQNLTGIAFLSKALSRKLATKSMPESNTAADIANHVSQAIAQTRTIARGLCPVGLTGDGLSSGLREFAERVEELYGISCQFLADENIAVPESSVATHMYSIVQEAVNNAVRHGKADSVEILLKDASGQITLSIRDNGLGIQDGLDLTKGMGLHTMRYRADTIGAIFDIKRHQSGGTLVSCLLPRREPKTPDSA